MSATEKELRELHDRLGPVAYQKAMAAACWRAGDLSYSLHATQERARAVMFDAYARGVRRAVWNIARRVGKTRAAVVTAAEKCLAIQRGRVPYAGQTEGTVAGFIEPHLEELAADAPEDVKPEKHEADWVFPSTEARLVMRGCEDRKKANRLRGPSADFAVIDEAGFIPELAYVVRDVMLPQLLTTDGMMLLSSSPPESPEHPFRGFALEAEERGAYMHATVYDAPHLSREAIERAMVEAGGEQSDTWVREYLARFVVDITRAVLVEFDALEEHIVGAVEPPSHRDRYVVGDLGYSDLTVILFAYFDFLRARIVVEDELVLRRPTSDTIHREVARKEFELWGPIKPYLRALDVRGITLADLRKLQPEPDRELERMKVQALPIGEELEEDPARWHSVANDELEAAVNALRLTITRRKLLIHPRCAVTRAHARAGIWNTQRTSFARVVNNEGGHHFDGLAALVYLNRTVRPHRNPEPTGLVGVDVPNSWVHYDRVKQGDRDRYRAAFTKPRMKRK